jgi:glutamate racemase
MPDPAHPIGLLDSGVGGLSVLREIRRLLPHESIVYYGDQAHLPYGPRSAAEIRSFVSEIARFLIARNCKLIVLACNAANAAALHPLRAEYPHLPIVGMEPALKPAAQATRSGVVGVLTTQLTYDGELFASVRERFAQAVRVEVQVCPGLVTLVEEGAPDTPEARATVRDYLAPLQRAGIDQLVLACTHFPFLASHIRAILGSQVTLVDPGPAVARQVVRVLQERALINPGSAAGDTRYYTSADPERMRVLVSALVGEVSPVVQKA